MVRLTRRGGKKGAQKRPATRRQEAREEKEEARRQSSSDDEVEEDRFGQIGRQSPSAKQIWTLEKERMLCEIWEYERHLYDTTVRDYRNSRRRQDAFIRISTVLQINGE